MIKRCFNKESILSVLVVSYLVLLLFLPAFRSYEIPISLIAFSFISPLLILYIFDWKLLKVEILFFLVIVITGFINIQFTESLTLRKQIYLLSNLITARMFLSKNSHAKHIKLMLYLYAGFIIATYYFGGIKQQIYYGSSENAISICSIAVCSLYYTLSEHYKKEIDIFPAILTFIICLLSRGRGGIISSLILLIGVGLYIINNKFYTIWGRRIITFMLILGMAYSIKFFIDNSHSLQEYAVFEHFLRRGLRSSSRLQIWDTYIYHATANIESLLVGVNFDKIYASGNPHNSFLDIHRLHGGVGLLFVVYLIVNALLYAYTNGKRIFALCLIVFILRGFTDKALWGTQSTLIFFFFILAPYYWKRLGKI